MKTRNHIRRIARIGLRLAPAIAALLSAGSLIAQDPYFKLPFHGVSREVVKLFDRQGGLGSRNVLFLVSPMTCPRCEGLAFDIMGKVKSRTKEPALCVVSYPRLPGAVDYVQKRGFPVPTFIDTLGTLFHELGIDQTPPFITIWDSTGSLVYSKALYGSSNEDDEMWSYIQGTSQMEVQEHIVAERFPQASTVGLIAPFPEWKAPSVAYKTRIQEDSTCKLGVGGFPSVNRKRGLLAITDHLSLNVNIFDLKTGRRVFDLTPDYTLRKSFSPDMGKIDFLRYEENGIAHTMFFGTFWKDDSTLIAAASFPEFFETPTVMGDGRRGVNRAYYNAAVMVAYSMNSGKVKDMKRIVTPPNSFLVVAHSSMTPVYDRKRDEIAIYVGKGYPFVGTTSAAAVGSGDPTNPTFYNHAPLFMNFSMKDGTHRDTHGRLDSINLRLGIGYANSSQRIAISGDEYYYSQNLSPFITTKSGKKFRLKSYFNTSILNSNEKATHLPTVDEIAVLTDSAGARIRSLDVHGKRMYVTWELKRKGMLFSDSVYVVVQHYSLPDGKLGNEWTIPYTMEDGKLADMSIDPAAGEAMVIYQNLSSTTAIAYKLD